MGTSWRQLRAILRKNWLLKIRHPFTTLTEIMLPTIIMVLLIAIRSTVDTQIHPAQAYIRKGMFVEVGKSEVSPSFDSLLQLLLARNEYLAFVPATEQTRKMLDVLSLRYPLLQMVAKLYEDESVLESYIRSDLYGCHDVTRNLSNPKIRGAIVFHEHGPQLFDYSIRLNHTWAFSGYPDVKTIMDVNGPYLNDLELGVNIVPSLQYSFSGFLTLQQVMDALIISVAKEDVNYSSFNYQIEESHQSVRSPGISTWSEFIPANIRIVPFPTREYTDDEFESLVKAVMGVLYLLGFLFPISRLISYSVFEKEQKIKEGLQMMGLRNKIFYLSWFITYTLQFAISSAIITASTMNSLFMYSDKSLVFIYFFLFSLSAIMLSFLISTFFSRAKTAVAVGTLFFLGAFFPYYSVNDPSIPMIWKILASLLSPAAFALGTINFADYERAHVGVRWTNMWQASSGVNFLVCLLMLMLDTIIYGSFWLLFDKALSRENGASYYWKFLLSKILWWKKMSVDHFDSPDRPTYEVLPEGSHYISDGSLEHAFEAISLDMKQQELDDRCLKIRNLHKVYASKKGNCCAVNFLNLSLYESQILALLGHNGAGKSTTISMLVGLIPPTSGDALVFGQNITTNMEDIRKALGVCPQHDILFPELTVKEHMEMFAALKGVDDNYLEDEVTEMINEVGLADKVNSIVGSLSGGMKRKLSLGIALIGNSKVIILDEPTSGMDPYAMRSTWQLIKKIKKGKIILLTTHSMDEADVLGDRIAIMANGTLRCCGSSLFLKNRFGVGYTLTIAKTSPRASVGAEIVHHHMPTAECISDVGSEVSFRLPLASSSLFVNMFREIESRIIRRPGDGDDSTFVENDCGIESYGISVTTLEEVFLKVAGQRLDGVDFHQYQKSLEKSSITDCQVSQSTLFRLSISKSYWVHAFEFFRRLFCAAGHVLSLFIGFAVFSLLKICCCSAIVRSVLWAHLKALFIKRAISARRDRRTVAFQLLIPAIFMFLGLLFLRIKPHPDQDSLILTTSHFNPLLSGGGGGGPIPFNLCFPVAEKLASHVIGGWIQKEEPRSYRFPEPEKALTDAISAAGPELGPLLLSMSEYLITSLNESYQSRYGAVVMDDQYADGSLGFTILHNCTCQHAAPTYINLMNAAILRLATGNSNRTIITRNHPLPMTMSQHAQRHDLDAFSASIIVSMAFSFIPASFAVLIVKEREVKAKQQQLISGVSVLAYWISIFAWDFFSFLFPASLAIFLFFIFDLNQFIGFGCLMPTIIIFLEYGAAVAASTYCLTFFFTDHSIAQNVILLVHFLCGIILMVISFIMGLINATKEANSFLKNFFRLSPSFCFADGLASLALRHQDMKMGSHHQVLDWNVTGASLCYLAVEIVLYFLITISLEYIPHYKIKLTTSTVLRHLLRYVKYDTAQSYSEPLLGSFGDSSMSITDEDVDVKAERQRILSGLGDNAIICLRNLRKVYPAGKKHTAKVAVHSLTFAVHEGECFGFLGTNGAGKTTTLSMLTGEECPTDGTAFIFGSEIRSNPKSVRQHIGYCPQFDALFEFLSPREHLQLYARIKSVPENIINNVVNEKLMEFDLCNHADKPSYTLSGGNKRKLSVAIAMIGDPPIVILDEPSTGMDPIAKRFLWDVISNLSTIRGKTAIILTTHSMNEAQALCTRIGIMVDGKLRCIGSPQHLKSRYGNHLELEVKPTEVGAHEIDDLCRSTQEILLDFPNHTRSILGDLETCIVGSSLVSSKSVAEISLTRDMIILIARMFRNEESIKTIISSIPISDGVFGEQLSEQLFRDGSIPLRIFCEWWLAKQKFTRIDSFILASFPGAKFHGCNGLSVKYQLPYGEHSSLSDIFGHLENNRRKLGIEDYSISQATLETIFNDFAAAV